MGAVKFLTAVLLVVASCGAVSASGGCYSYQDHAAQYHLDPVASSYPWDEVKYMLNKNPQLSEVMAKGTLVPTSRPPGGYYYKPVSVVCPSQRFMLKAFNVDNKQCWVIKPEVQQLRYTRCSDKNNRDCYYCNYNHGGINKCEEDYEWQTVWAYCKPIIKPNPYPQPRPYPQPFPYPKPTFPSYPKLYPNPTHYAPNQPKPTKLYAKTYYDPYAYKRWKRSISYGKLEKISLYLPYQCSCKSFKC